jgi:signal transduction histidine kinase
MCRNFQEATGVETECHPGNLNQTLPERVFQALFRTVQVGFINALRHGRASKIRLLFWVRSDGLTMTIRNNIENADFDTDQPTDGIGLKGVRERIGELEGEIQMVRSSGEFALTVLIPDKELHDRDDLQDSS